jgi:hypothetical protein
LYQLLLVGVNPKPDALKLLWRRGDAPVHLFDHYLARRTAPFIHRFALVSQLGLCMESQAQAQERNQQTMPPHQTKYAAMHCCHRVPAQQRIGFNSNVSLPCWHQQ